MQPAIRLLFLSFVTGTGRSVPSTPLQVSPQGEQQGGEGTSEVGPSGERENEQAEEEQCEGT